MQVAARMLSIVIGLSRVVLGGGERPTARTFRTRWKLSYRLKVSALEFSEVEVGERRLRI